MEHLFQEFLFATMYRSPEFRGHRVLRQRATRIVWLRGTGLTSDITIRPDIKVSNTRDILVVDAKYKNPVLARVDRWTPVSDDVYQIMAYCVVHRCNGVLVYPRTQASEADIDEVYGLRGSDSCFKLKTIDLAGELRDLKAASDEVCRNLRDFLEGPCLQANTNMLPA
jgi:5-methylcytosine-specific restriction endonuclease McrBC regulatory subunit McrC